MMTHTPDLEASDGELLARYLTTGSQQAFSALVAGHQKMVLGAAFRKTSDLELAREIAQEVFTLLARKGAWLCGRKCLAGWLYQTASYLAARAARRETRMRARQEAAAQAAVSSRNSADILDELDAGIGVLSEKEREALLLYYFEDRSYAEIATVLGLTEAAARQRVSRSQRSLGNWLQRRGYLKGAGALLVTGASTQAALPEVAATSAVLTAPSTIPLKVWFTLFMSNHHLKLALLTVALCAAPILSLQQTHASLKRERESAEISKKVTSRSPVEITGGTSEQREQLSAAIRSVRAQLEREKEKTAVSRKQLADLRKAGEADGDVITLSHGKITDMAAELAGILRKARDLKDRKKPLSPEQVKALENLHMDRAVSIAFLARELESNPAKAGLFYGTLFCRLVDLPSESSQPVIDASTLWFEQLSGQGLRADQRPPHLSGNNLQQSQWMKMRRQYFDTLQSTLTAKLPPDAQKTAKQLPEDLLSITDVWWSSH